MNPATAFTDSKQHYPILDGLRGVAAIMVVLFHILELFSNGDHSKQIINHGYLAVDFFFILSGFVIAYSYDDRWPRMTLAGFFKRRLIRLHPMIVIGMIWGAALFYFQGSALFPLVDETPLAQMLIVLLVGMSLVPLPSSMDIRGWAEMHPLNGPAWTLFLEYVANIAYALFLRKLSTRSLVMLCLVAAGLTIQLSVTRGDLIGGWSFNEEQLRIGFTRLLFPFAAGLLLARVVKPRFFSRAFVVSSLLLAGSLSLPWIGDHDVKWMNGLYDALIVILLFPLIVVIGASGRVTGAGEKLCNFLGDISYPIYITHYPIIYVFYAWTTNGERAFDTVVIVSVLTFVATMVVAYTSFRLFDVPVRKWLTKRLSP